MNYEITSGVIPSAIKVCVFGPEGIGKSTFASQFPDPLFIDTEGSTKQLAVKRLPKPQNFQQLIDEIQYVCSEPTPICKTLVIDTMDWAEKLIIDEVCNQLQVTGIEEIGYGKGYTYVSEKMQTLLHRLDNVIYKGINVVITAHAMLRTFYEPDEMGQYDRWELKVTKKSAPIVKEWVDMLLFANYKTYIIKDSKTGKSKGQGGQRVMYTTHNPAWDAKNRFGLPDQLPFEYKAIEHIFNHTEPTEEVKITGNDQPIDLFAEKEDIYESPKEDIQVDNSALGRFRRKLEEYKISDEEVINYVNTSGVYPEGTPVNNYQDDFLEYLLNNFNKFYVKIVDIRNPLGE